MVDLERLVNAMTSFMVRMKSSLLAMFYLLSDIDVRSSRCFLPQVFEIRSDGAILDSQGPQKKAKDRCRCLLAPDVGQLGVRMLDGRGYGAILSQRRCSL